MYRAREKWPLVMAVLLVTVATIGIHRANVTVKAHPMPDLCGISAVRVQVREMSLISIPATVHGGSLASAVTSYLQSRDVPIAPSTDDSAPLLWFIVNGLPLEGQYSVVVSGGLEEACSVGRRPGSLMKYCQTWQFGPHLALVPRGEEERLVAIVNTAAEQFARVFARTAGACSKP